MRDVDANPSEAHRLAILAGEDARAPVRSPHDSDATLGKFLSQMEAQGSWAIPLSRQHPKASTQDVVVGRMRALRHGQHDRHGGQSTARGRSLGE